MEVFKKLKEFKEYIHSVKKSEKTIGLVPTMGALHQGHISLIRNAKKENDIVIATVFVNRIQFTNPSDFEKYPKSEEQDLLLLEKEGTDTVFLPEEAEIYNGMEEIQIDLGQLGKTMEAKFRPGHFEGVVKIVYRFFELVQPDTAYFGQKDLQQYKVIEKLTEQRNLDIRLRLCPTIREDNGLAMSSRNKRLGPEHLELASKIYGALNYAGDLLSFGDSVSQTKKKVADFISKFKPLELEYFEIADSETLLPRENVKVGDKIALFIAVHLNGVRLIDNITIIC